MNGFYDLSNKMFWNYAHSEVIVVLYTYNYSMSSEDGFVTFFNADSCKGYDITSLIIKHLTWFDKRKFTKFRYIGYKQWIELNNTNNGKENNISS